MIAAQRHVKRREGVPQGQLRQEIAPGDGPNDEGRGVRRERAQDGAGGPENGVPGGGQGGRVDRLRQEHEARDQSRRPHPEEDGARPPRTPKPALSTVFA